MIPRTLSHILLERAKGYPVVTLTGPRQSGKTTLVQAAFPGHVSLSMEVADQRVFAPVMKSTFGLTAARPGADRSKVG
jgi:hypothetical protein